MNIFSKTLLIVALLAVSGCAAGGGWEQDANYKMTRGPVAILGPTGGIF